MIRLTRLLTPEEYRALNDDAMSRGYYRDDHRTFQPGWGWYNPWYWDPVEASRIGVSGPDDYLAKFPKHDGPFDGIGLLSRFYWETWAKVRPPLCVVLPNGMQWEIDRKSSNGEGWTVSGTWPDLVCNPSIDAPGYHGWLGSGGAPAGHFVDVPGSHYPHAVTWRRTVQFDPNDPRRIYTETMPGDPPADYRGPPEPEGGFTHCQRPGDPS